MKKLYYLAGFLLLITFYSNAQDEGKIVKRERISKSSNIFLGGGMSFTFGSNIGDYSKGYNVDLGYLKRLNRVLSIGGGFSYQTFEYDEDKTTKSLFLSENTFTSPNDYLAKSGVLVGFEGGTLNLMTLGCIVKLNFVPVMDDSKVSVYAFARPFVSYVNRKDVLGAGVSFYMEDTNFDEQFDQDEFANGTIIDIIQEEEASGDSKEYNGFTGGIFIGPGIELNPGKSFSVSLQASVGYTLPVSFISTSKYEDMSLEEALDSEYDYPITKEGFPSFNIQLGFSYNF